MAYLDVLPLATVKTYLRIDDTQNETDAEITSMIKSALMYMERKTNIMVYARNKDYVVIKGCARVYDAPVNSVTTPSTAAEYSVETKHLYKNYTIYDSDVETLTLNVGYTDEADVPDDIINVALQIIKIMFYEAESDKTFNEMLPQWATETINSHRRFTI